MSTSPFFSIIIPTFNSPTILRAIGSVVAQAFESFEIVVVDDGGSDDVEKQIASLGNPAITCVRQENAGPGAARNRGAGLAKGSYFIFLDSDDRLCDDFLSKAHDILRDGKIDLILGFIQFVNEKDKPMRRVEPWKSENTFGYAIAGSFVLAASKFRNLEGYDPKLTYSENTDLFLRLELSGTVPLDRIQVSKGIGVFLTEIDLRVRSHKYLRKKYESTRYFLEKHNAFFQRSEKYFIIYKRIFAVCAAQNHAFGEARSAMKEVIAKSPFNARHYAQYFIMCIPPLARYYYRTQ